MSLCNGMQTYKWQIVHAMRRGFAREEKYSTNLLFRCDLQQQYSGSLDVFQITDGLFRRSSKINIRAE